MIFFCYLIVNIQESIVPNDLIAAQNWQKMIFTQSRKEALSTQRDT
jgi:hypothetical protein